MARKAVWIAVLLVALLAITAGAAFAMGINRTVQAALTPRVELSATGSYKAGQVHAKGGGSYSLSKAKSYDRGDCPFESDSASSPAY